MARNSTRLLCSLTALAVAMSPMASLQAQQQEAPLPPTPVVQKIVGANTKLEMTVNSSRILAMDQPIPRAQVANPDLLDFTVLSENQVQIHAKKAGMTTVNLWDDKDEVHSIDVIISGDVRELDRLLRIHYPTAAIKLYPTSASTLMIFGYVDRPEYVNRIMRIAEDYYPKVLNNMIVGGSQQVLLNVKVMQISRTKLREAGFDWMASSGNNYGGSVVGGLITKASPTTSLLRGPATFTTNGTETMQFGVLSGTNGFVGMIEALKQDDILKVMAEPKLVAVSGRPATCNVGGEVAYPQPTGFGNISVAFRPFGTQIDFVPIVLGNGGCRLEVRPRVSEVDYTLGTSINGTSVPGFRVREADTGVELKFGQTLAIAGLLSQQSEQQVKGIPYLMDIPYVGAAFRKTHNKINEVELLILVTPELVDALDPDQVPPCGPGMNSMAPDDCGLYWKGYREVPVRPGGRGPVQPGLEGPYPEQVDPQQPSPTPRVEEMPAAPSAARPRGNATATISDEAGGGPALGGQGYPGSYNPPRQAARPSQAPAISRSSPPGFIGPRGYDVRN